MHIITRSSMSESNNIRPARVRNPPPDCEAPMNDAARQHQVEKEHTDLNTKKRSHAQGSNVDGQRASKQAQLNFAR